MFIQNHMKVLDICYYYHILFHYNSKFVKTSKNNIRVPASFDYQKPAVDFALGTSCLQALKELALMCNCQFIIQPDGKGYFYEMDDIGKPIWIGSSPTVKTYKNSDIISWNINPYLENKYNTFLTMGYLIKQVPKDATTPINVSTKPGIMLTKVSPAGANYPWSRIITKAAPGYVTKSELEKFHNANKKFGLADIYQGTVTVPGYPHFALFDKVSIADRTYYIIGITQNIDLQTKTWTTGLQIAKIS